MTDQEQFVAYLKAEIDGAMAAIQQDLTRWAFPIFYWVNTREEEQQLEWRLNCLMLAAGHDVYGVLPAWDEGLDGNDCECC